jgi:raffinose/stachyose/melibiose transport system substrate-binding protein
MPGFLPQAWMSVGSTFDYFDIIINYTMRRRYQARLKSLVGRDARRGEEMQSKLSRRRFLEVAGATAMATSLAGCFGVGGSSSTSNGGSTSTVTVWDIRTGNEKTVVQNAVNSFNKSQSAINVKISYYENDPYKQKLQVAMGAKNPPDVFFGWGGGGLKSYIDAGDVYDMTADLNGDSAWKNKFFPSILSGATFNGKIYGVPTSGMQTISFFYNKAMFSQYKLTVPKTWDEFINVINVLKGNKVIPIALAGASKWPYLMFAEYLVDRQGGSKVFTSVFNKEPNAWSDPAFLQANATIQSLVSMGAFGTTYTSTTADTNQDVALLYTGKAGMMLQGNWNFSTIQANQPDFITSGKLGWFPFPTVAGGTGDPANVYGNPCNFNSISSTAKSPANAVAYLKSAVLSYSQVSGYIGVGDVPPIQNLEAQLSSAKNSDWLLYNYNLAKNAPSFQLSWDQALDPTPAQAVLTNLDQIFLNQITPKQFSDNMNKAMA